MSRPTVVDTVDTGDDPHTTPLEGPVPGPSASIPGGAEQPGRPAEHDHVQLGTGRTGRRLIAFAVLLAGLAVAAVAALTLGSVRLPPSDVLTALFNPEEAERGTRSVVRSVRLPRTLAAMLTGAALAVCGAQMQTVFRNPLADPFVLGVTSGASFGVAVVVLTAGTGASLWIGGLGALGGLSIAGAAFVGAMATTLITLVVSQRVRGTASILIVGVMIGSVLTALISIMVAAADPLRLQQFMAWGFGSFRGITNDELIVMAPLVLAGLVAALLYTKPLDALLLGDRYAASLGLPVRRTRVAILATASLLTGVVTAFAGPIGFIGIAAPHLARPLLGTSRHRVLLPGCALLGATLALVAEVVAQLPGREGVLPLNAVTALVGGPVVVWVLVRRSRSEVIV